MSSDVVAVGMLASASISAAVGATGTVVSGSGSSATSVGVFWQAARAKTESRTRERIGIERVCAGG